MTMGTMGTMPPTVSLNSARSACQGRRAKVSDDRAIVEMTEGRQRYCVPARILPTLDGRLPLRYFPAVQSLPCRTAPMTTPLDERIEEIERRIADAQDWIADGSGHYGGTVSDAALLTVVAQINEPLKASAERLQALEDTRVREEP